ncbi:MAG TPA: VWA domain-containing protein [Allosphingosinicella sp.]|jgi:Ca-activated chloride channel family protein
MNLRLSLLLSAALLSFAAPAAFAQDTAPPPPEDEAVEDPGDGSDSIVVTGSMRVRQGGAQDAGHFRAAAELGMPRPESLTLEGLMGEHDLTLPEARPCAQLFCLVTEAMTARLPLRPDDKLFVGLGFASNIVAESWKREPLHLVAVVDKSGSMDGEPLDLVRKSLKQIVEQMRDGDRLSIVLYGDESHLYLAPTEIGADRAKALAAIGRIESAGSTNMEAGLRVGYDTAFAAKPGFAGTTRLMLFTDEQPNVGATDPESFMGMAQAASRAGIGLTTIGVGIQFDGELATDISSVRGGNLYFIANAEEVKSVFAEKLDTMVSELAHDVRITMTPRDGYKLTGVFGVPDGLMRESEGGAVTITVPTAFLSTNGGGIFASLGKAADRASLPAAALTPETPLMEVSLSYVSAKDGVAGADRSIVSNPSGVPSAGLRLAHLLTDEYFALHGASTAFHSDDDPKRAFALLSGFSQRLESSGIAKLGDEKKLVGEMLAQASFHSGYGGEQPAPLAVRGTWEVFRADGIEDVGRGDRLAFGEDEEVVTTRRNGEEDYGAYKINRRQIFFPEDGEVFNYRVKGDILTLVHESGAARLYLKRVAADTDS